MLWSTADVGVEGSRGSGASLNAAPTRSVWEGSSVSRSVFMLKHACICIHAHVITQTVATHLFPYNTCMQIPPPFFCLLKSAVLPPALASEEKTADGQTDKAETSGPAVAPQKGPAPCPRASRCWAGEMRDPVLSPEPLWKAGIGEEAPVDPGGDPAGALILSTVAKGLLVSGIIQQHGRSR